MNLIILYIRHPKIGMQKKSFTVLCFQHAVEWASKGYLVSSQIHHKKKGDKSPICDHCKAVIG